MNNLTLHFTLNGRETEAFISPEMSLLTVLKELLNVGSVKRACVGGECGACTVIVDGKAMNSCLILAASAEGCYIETLESLGTPEHLHPLQRVFYEMGATQCGFCTPGFIMSAKALLDQNPNPNEEDIRIALSGNLCRCTGYVKPVKAVQQAVAELQTAEASVAAVTAIADAALRINGITKGGN